MVACNTRPRACELRNPRACAMILHQSRHLRRGAFMCGRSSTDLSPTSVRDRSLEALANLSHALRKRLPDARLQSSTRRSADEDFFVLAHAPLAVIAGGSFGLTAVAAGAPGQQVRLPACDSHLDVVHSRRRPSAAPALRSGWREYAYELVAARTPTAPPEVLFTASDDGRMRYSFGAIDAV